ncbi:MAG TPA: OmpH family outer membrane protein [Bacteroidota bacterium]|nr:OmpH family outer membrane protein [Bacteroidota bacterium]
MKTFAATLLLAVFFAAPGTTAGQAKIGWFNSAAIMEKLPEAQDAQHQIDNLIADWQEELAKMQNEWQKRYEEYQTKKLIMTDQLRAQEEKDLQDMDKKIIEYRNKKFGQSGELFAKQNELMKPVQNKIFKVLEDVAQEEEYDYIFDKSGDVLLMYTSEKYDLTSVIFDRMVSFNK